MLLRKSGMQITVRRSCATMLQLARNLEEERELLEIGRFLFNLKPRDLAQQFASRAAGLTARPKLENYEIAVVAAAKLDAIVVDQFVPLHRRSVYISAVL